MQNLNGKLLKFLSGSQAKIQQMISDQAHNPTTEGAFYLTEDTHRLYIGADVSTYESVSGNDVPESPYYKGSDGKYYTASQYEAKFGEPPLTGSQPYARIGGIRPIPINAGIEQVNSINDLPPNPNLENGTATFYYVDTGNILCIYGITGKDSNDNDTYGWIQINSDTYVNNIRYNTTHIYNKVPQNESFDENKTYYIKNATGGYEQQVNLTGFSQGVDYYLQGEEVAVVSLIPNNYNELNKDVNINLIEGNNITLTPSNLEDNKGVKIEATDTIGTLSVPATEANSNSANIVLTNTDGTNTSTSNVTIQPGTLIDSVIGAATGNITINASSQRISNGTIVSTNNNESAEIHIPQVNGLQQAEGTEAAWRGASITLPRIKYGSGSLSTYNEGTINLNVYSQNQIDQLLAEATSGALATGNAMSYKELITKNNLKVNNEWASGDNVYSNLAYLLEQSPTGVSYEIVPSGTHFNSTEVYYTESDGVYTVATGLSDLAEGGPYYTKVRTNVNIGDTYRIGGTANIPLDASQTSKFSSDALRLITTIGTTNYLVPGDLLIFNSDYKWEIVPAGNEPTYRFNLSNTSPIDDSEPNKSVAIELKDSNNVTKGTFNLTRDDDQALTVGLSEQNNNIITIKHKKYTNNVTTLTNDPIGFNDTLTYVSAITKDDHGHITAITTGAKKISHNYVTGFSVAKSGQNTKDLRWSLSQAYPETNLTVPFGLDFTTNNLDITTSVNSSSGIGTVNIDLKWGSF